MYIYKITNKINGKIYIGQSTKSVDDSKDYYGSGILIKNAIKKYGISNFEKTILIECESKYQLDEYEKHYIKEYNSIGNGYNISMGGNGGDLGSIVNLKISNTLKTIWNDQNSIFNSNAFRYNLSNSLKNRIVSNETKEKISKSQKGENGFWYGKQFSKEHRNNIKTQTLISYTNCQIKNKFLAIMQSDEHRKKLSLAHKGQIPWNAGKKNVYTKEQLLKMSNSAKNRKIDTETEKIRREKISKHFSENHPSKKRILDVSNNVIYDSIKDFCNKTNISWYKTKRMRKNGLLKEIT